MKIQIKFSLQPIQQGKLKHTAFRSLFSASSSVTLDSAMYSLIRRVSKLMASSSRDKASIEIQVPLYLRFSICRKCWMRSQRKKMPRGRRGETRNQRHQLGAHRPHSQLLLHHPIWRRFSMRSWEKRKKVHFCFSFQDRLY